MKLYVAGPMTGLPNYNFPAFAEATARLRSQGHEVISPAEHDIEMDWVRVEYDSCDGILVADKREEGAFDWAEALDWDLGTIDQCDGIYLLPGWSRSRGAVKEYAHAKAGHKVILGALNEKPDTPVKHQPLVGLVGYAQAGKDTFAGYLGYNRIAFADKLKDLALTLEHVEFGHPDDGELMPLPALVNDIGWERAKAEVFGVRQLLQDLGVGARVVLGADTWVEAAFTSYDPTLPTVITDVRFPNEIAAIRDRGGVIVRIDREGNTPPNKHVSEFAWQSTTPDVRLIFADGALDAMQQEAALLDNALRRNA